MRRGLTLVGILAVAGMAYGEPLIPSIVAHELNFGAFNQGPDAEYATNGTQPDTLVYSQHNIPDHEVTAYWPDPTTPPVYPVWEIAPLNGLPAFGGDFVMGVQFDAQDAPVGSLDVSLTGTGLIPDGADLEIYGMIDLGGGEVLEGLLWALDITDVSLYGYSGEGSYVLEGVGLVADSLIAQQFGLVGSPGAVSGRLDFTDRRLDLLRPSYDPLMDARDEEVRATYFGDTGVVPEPASLGLLLGGLLVLIRRR